MGMSSSQARLLTLTARMHDIEYRAQRLEAQKLQMANESRRAYEDYLNELDRTKLEAKVLGQDGSMTAIPFTAGAVYTYKQLGNQYALKTSEDKTIISEEYHNAYNQTDTLNDYLKMFNAVSSTSNIEINTVPNPEYQIEEDRYNAAVQSWEQRKAANEAEHLAWENMTGRFDQNNYQKSIINENLFDKNNGIFGVAYDNVMNPTGGGESRTYKNICAIFGFIIGYNTEGFYTQNNGDCCKWITPKNDGTWHYSHYNTSLGNDCTLGCSTTANCDDVAVYTNNVVINNLTKYYDGTKGTDLLHSISEALLNAEDDFMATGDTTKNEDFANNYNSLTDYEKLISQWDQNGYAKTFRQWVIDLFYVTSTEKPNTRRYKFIEGTASQQSPDVEIDGEPSNSGVRERDYQNMLSAFKERLEQFTYFDSEEYENAEPEPFNEPAPVKRTVPEFIEERTTNVLVNITDKNYAQWLINLWYKMEGSDESAEIRTEQIKDDETGETTTIYTVDDKVKSNTTYETNKYDCLENENYIVIPQDKLNDPEWLKNCILEGWVLIQQFDQKGVKFNDTSVAVDTHLQEVSDEKNLKKAEAKYEADMRRIDQKDRRYDTQLAALDTERNAIKQEMETVKTVARDNVDRTFKLFS